MSAACLQRSVLASQTVDFSLPPLEIEFARCNVGVSGFVAQLVELLIKLSALVEYADDRDRDCVSGSVKRRAHRERQHEAVQPISDQITNCRGSN